MLTLIIILLIAISVFILGLITFTSSKEPSAKYFGLLATVISFWITVNYLGINKIVPLDLRVTMTYFDYALGVLMACAFLMFTASVAELKRPLQLSKIIILPIAVFFALVTLLGFVVDIYIKDNLLMIDEQILFYPYILFIGLVAFTGVFLLVKKHQSSQPSHRKRLYLIVWGLSIAVIVAVLANVVLPLFISNRNDRLMAAYATYFSVLLFVVFTFVAISKHKLFNLREAAARSTVYLLSIVSILIVYTISVLIFSSTNLLSSDNELRQRILFAILAVVSGLLFQPFKQFFDKTTSKLFYRDSYDPQSLIDVLNNTLVNTIEIEELLTKSALIIQENLKTSFCTFYIRETSYFKERIIGAHRKDPEIDEIDKLQQLAPRLHRKIHSVENEPSNDNEKEISRIMRKNDIEILARIVSTLDYEIKGIGYMLIGPKKSGSQYSKQDIKIIEIIANELVIAIENALRFEEIEQFNVTLQKKIDDATKELKQTNEKLRALDEAKDEFVSMASHQLRTPLTSIKGYLSMVLEGDAGKITDQQKTMLGQAFFSSQRMVYLISDLLNVSRLKTGKFVIETKPVYLPDVVESELNQLYEGANAKNLKLSFTKPKKFATMNLDEMKLRQVIMNFTDNAIYYTPSGGKITVELKETPKSVEFSVKDTGIGVPKEQQHKLFAKFYRADNARKARPDGTGLGLFMAKKVIIAQGGSMIFDSKENKGSTFGFSFPKEKLEVKV